MKKFTDIRIPFAGLLGLYLFCGVAWLGFSRSPWQVGLTVATAVLADCAANYLLRGRKLEFPWSGLITGFGLSLLLNYGSHAWLPVLPALLAIASKHIFVADGRHVFNPGLFGLIVGMALSGGELSPAPAYQWNATSALAAVLAGLALVVFVPKIKRTPLLVAFLGFYSVQMLFRAWVMRYHIPMETIFLGTISSPAFFLFVFYMLTDPATSPKSWRGQIGLAFAVTAIDLLLHFKQSYSTLFPALFLVQSATLVTLWARAIRRQNVGWWKPLLKAGCFLLIAGVCLSFTHRDPADAPADFKFTRMETKLSGLGAANGSVFDAVDPRLQHIAKWLLSVGDAVAIADVNNNGYQDVFLSYPLKESASRAALFLNRGNMSFERFEIDEITKRFSAFPENGLPSSPIFADYDNDGDQDLFLGVSFGENRLYQNRLVEDGQLTFVDVTEAAGISGHSVCLAAVFFDADSDGLLDLLVGNALSPHLLKYDDDRKLNLFDLPAAEYEGDRRMFHFMHTSWHRADNGGEFVLYKNLGNGKFEKLSGAEIGMPETHWTLALNTADFNNNGLPDVYAASDFGPDDVYLNQGNFRFERLAGRVVGQVGKDTYKGMNVSIADFNGDSFPDVYVSNVHVPLQAEGSLVWLTEPDPKKGAQFTNASVRTGLLNPHRFGWGAAVADLDLNGEPDLIQANGMVDDSIDQKFSQPQDYWYVNGRLMRTGPEVHAYADRWGDLRGYSIWGLQKNRVLLNQGGHFKDAADTVGLGELGNARGVGLADFDNDGDVDLLLTHQFKPASLYRNDQAEPKNWIGIQLSGDGTQIARDAIGARVTVHSGDQTTHTWIQPTSGFSAQGDRRLVVGIQEATCSVEIVWPDGVEWTSPEIEEGRYYTITRSDETGSEIKALPQNDK